MFGKRWKKGWKSKDSEDDEGPHHRLSEMALSQDDYTIGWICALPLEMAAARAMLDDIHPDVPNGAKDQNGYIFGAIGDHSIVIACLPSGIYGTTPAALVASQMQSSFPSIRFYLMVGIGGGVPTTADIRLGDVVVGIPTGRYPGVVQYDRGKTLAGGRFEETGTLNRPPRELLNIVSKLRAFHLAGCYGAPELLADALGKLPASASTFTRPTQDDILFRSEYNHTGGDTCDLCDKHEIVSRPIRETCDPVLHYGLIASGNQVMKDGTTRDFIGQKLGAYCFEMEAAGLADVIECLAIRGICDYSDSHKNKQWQQYAAATAAAYAKELISTIPVNLSPSTGQRSYENRDRRRYPDKFSWPGQKWALQSLCFPNMDSRLHNIASAHKNTCDWIFESNQFQRWELREGVDSFNGVLWIKGKPGAGKSTLMKHILRYCQKSFRNCSVAAYFFNARGGLLEKSRCGLLRSLVYQLMDQDRKAAAYFLPLFRDKQRKHGNSWEWSEGELESLLIELLPSLTRPALLLVDALDECNEPDARRVVSFLEELSLAGASAPQCSMRICLSSRHYPTISMRKMLDLVMDNREGHAQDITTYVRDKLRVQDEKIEAELLRRAAGVFMWIVLVVEMLNQAYDSGNIHLTWRTLQEVPGDINDVFCLILEKDNPNKHQTVFMLLFVLFAKRQLTPVELYQAVLSGSESGSLQPRDPLTVTDQVIERFITNGSRGLIEIRPRTGNPSLVRNLVVQFVHETVNDFLLRDGRLQKLDSELGLVTRPHDPDPSVSDINARGGVYATALIAAVVVGSDPGKHATEEIIQMLLDAGADVNAQGGKCRNALQAAVRPNHKRLRDYSKTATIICMLLKAGADPNTQGGYYGNALQAAAATAADLPFHLEANADGISKIIQMLLHAGADVNAGGGHYGSALQAAAASAATINLEKFRESELKWICSMRVQAIIQMLLDAGADVNAQGGYYGNALQAAVVPTPMLKEGIMAMPF
ncbi:hypothetical protein ABW21_db0208293 [Orbilia brochopaga]|nr:hypothetical protein ABW21_db0208293 [Drechslerella brochopaga]